MSLDKTFSENTSNEPKSGDDDRENSVSLGQFIGLRMNTKGAYIIFDSVENSKVRAAHYALHQLDSQQVIEIASAIREIGEQLEELEMLGADGDFEAARTKTSTLIH